jgi:hypothetical protein
VQEVLLPQQELLELQVQLGQELVQVQYPGELVLGQELELLSQGH